MNKSVEPKVNSRLHFHIKAADLSAKGNVSPQQDYSALTSFASLRTVLTEMTTAELLRRGAQDGSAWRIEHKKRTAC